MKLKPFVLPTLILTAILFSACTAKTTQSLQPNQATPSSSSPDNSTPTASPLVSGSTSLSQDEIKLDQELNNLEKSSAEVDQSLTDKPIDVSK